MRLYEVIDQLSKVHLVMELCHGANLHHVLKKQKEQSEPFVKKVMR
jgi:hypothetical protein